MAEDDRFPRTPVLVEDLRPVARRDRRHALPPELVRLLHVRASSPRGVGTASRLADCARTARDELNGRAPLSAGAWRPSVNAPATSASASASISMRTARRTLARAVPA